jgi:undecaprenyl-diphosphatase
LKTTRRLLPLLACVAVTAASGRAAPAAGIRLTYLPASADGTSGPPPDGGRFAAVPGDAATPPVAEFHSDFLPREPLRHPFQTIAGLNRNGEDVFKQPGALPYLLIGAAALATDRQTEKWFNVPDKGEKKSSFSSTFSTIGSGEVIVPSILAMYAAGHGRERDTAKLWAAAVANATLWTEALKLVAGKERPDASDGAIVYHGPGSLKNDSFPSGHMTAATASAVVLGHQYPRYKLLFYGLAAGVGIARIEHRNHWPSDVYWGAGVGYYGGWQAIRNKDAILQWRF